MKFNLILAVLLVPALALAQDDISQGIGKIGAGKKLGAQTIDGQTTFGVMGLDANGNLRLSIPAGKVLATEIGGTPAASFDANSGIPAALPAVITPMTALTPVAGAALTARVSIIATAAPTFAIVMLPAATSNPNKQTAIYNKSASPVLMHNSGVAGTDVINALGAGTPYSCATAKFCDCRVIGTGSLMCVSI